MKKIFLFVSLMILSASCANKPYQEQDPNAQFTPPHAAISGNPEQESSRTPAANALEEAAKGLIKNAVDLGNDKINIQRFPYLCTTSDPWGRTYDSYSDSEAKARQDAHGKCGIFTQCKKNLACVDRRKTASTTTQSPPPQIIVQKGPTVIERCSDDKNALRNEISKLQAANSQLAQSSVSWKTQYETLSKNYSALYETYVAQRFTHTDKLIVQCAKKFEHEHDIERCVELAKRSGGDTGHIAYCGSYTEYYSDYKQCFEELVINKIPVERFEACKRSSYWHERKACLRY